MNNYQRLNTIIGWLTFALSAVVFLLTIEPTASWWDPGEFISTTYKLQIGHPPGAPTMQLIGRVFSLFAFGNTAKVAMMINAMSAICSALAVLFLFWVITMFARKIVAPDGEMTRSRMWTIFAAGFIGAMTFAFTDSFWFSAVEGEVYAMSAMFTSLVFRAIMKWESVADEKHSSRWLIFIALMIGFAIGVHLLNLLTIPAIGFVIYFRKFKPSRKGMLLTLLISILVLAFIMYFVIPWIPNLAGKFEILFVNSFHLPFQSGTVFYFALLVGLIVWGLWYTHRTKRPMLNSIILAFAFLLMGYSTFLVLVIRANADTPINENDPKDIVGLVSYLNREQYGTWPIFYGQYYNAPVVGYEDGSPVYAHDSATRRYVVVDDRKGTIPVYDSRFMTIFPRIWSREGDRQGTLDFYKKWGGEGVPITITDEDGKTQVVNKPTFAENLKYFLTYQVGWMYLRYFLWNYSGRQNDVQGFGGIENGNWITGIPFIDKLRLGHDQLNLPDNKKNWGTNRYYMLPLILGLIGFFFQAKKESRGTIVITMLFIMTGLAIVVYLNQKPFEPRERDYSYCGSTYAFAIWIGLGVVYLVNLAKKYLKREYLPLILVFAFCLLLVPANMAKENWDDHDRSGKFSCRDFAANYLNSCDKQAILITNGDNDTFPLWYDQEVEGIRTDVRVVNFMLASGGWYIDQLYQKMYDSNPLPFTLKRSMYGTGKNEIIPFYDIGVKGYTNLKDIIDFINSDDPETFLTLQNGEKIKYIPTRNVKLAVDKDACIKNGIVPLHLKDKMVDTIYWTIRGNQLYKNDIMLLDFVASNNWTRPLYFASPGSVNHVFNLEKFCSVTGWVYKFMPVPADSVDYIKGMGGVDALTSYDILMNRCKWGNLSDPHVYIDPESLNNSVRPKTNVMRVAQSLVSTGKKKEAVRLLNSYLNNFPDAKITYDMYMLPYADVYFKAGDTAKAIFLMRRVAQVFAQNLDYYMSYDPAYRQYFQNDVNTNMGMLRRISVMATENKQAKLAAEMDSLFKKRLKSNQ